MEMLVARSRRLIPRSRWPQNWASSRRTFLSSPTINPPMKKFPASVSNGMRFGWPLDNFAFINASRTVFGDQDRCLLEIANYSAAHVQPN